MNAVEQKFLQYVERGYFSVDSEGRIWRHRIHRKGSKSNLTWLPLAEPRRAETEEGDYLAVKMELWGRTRSIQAHRAVYLVLVGLIPDSLLINHKDGDKHHNNPSNLEPATNQENTVHAKDVLKHGPWHQQTICKLCGQVGNLYAYQRPDGSIRQPPVSRDSVKRNHLKRIHICHQCLAKS